MRKILDVMVGQKVHTNDGNIGTIEDIINSVATIRLNNKSIIYRFVGQVIKIYE